MRPSSLSEWLLWQEKLHPSSIDLGLDRVRRTLERLKWQAPRCPVITVGGTNGKGSTVALIRRMLSASGYRVGTFTSPHLIRYNERITIAEREVSDASLVAAFERIDVARGDDTLTFFEFNTLAALLIFEGADLDAMVLEVGLGGRLDAVNVVDADLAIISSIGLDHCDWLGADIETIAAEKAGIMRRERPVIFGSRKMPNSIELAARQLGSHLQRLGRDFDWEASANIWNWRGRQTSHLELPMPALHGEAQLENASTALAALETLQARLPVSRTAIETGLRTVSLPGRFQVIECGAQWVLDVAHNPDAASTLAENLRASPERRPTIAVCGVLGDKDLPGIIAPLAGSFDGWVAAELQGPRARPIDSFADELRKLQINVLATSPSVPAACERALQLAGKQGRIVVFGSFLTVGPALEWLGSRCVTSA
jgi:dihydrofolate synthase / folylpolyglutamate synthase